MRQPPPQTSVKGPISDLSAKKISIPFFARHIQYSTKLQSETPLGEQEAIEVTYFFLELDVHSQERSMLTCTSDTLLLTLIANTLLCALECPHLITSGNNFLFHQNWFPFQSISTFFTSFSHFRLHFIYICSKCPLPLTIHYLASLPN